jgi:lauroyl/myristoyl acyltransferase
VGGGRLKEAWNKKWRYGFLYPLLGKLPRSLAYEIAYRTGGRAGFVVNADREFMKRNLMNVLGEDCDHSRIIKEHNRMRALESLDPYFLKFIPEPYRISDFMEFRNLEALKRAHQKGRGVVLFGGHYGRASLPLVGLGHMNFRVGCITVEIQENPNLGPSERSYLQMKSDEVERHAGGVFARRGKVGDLKQLYRLLKEKGLVTVLLDVVNSENGGVKLPFLGGLVRFPVGVLKFACYNRSPVVGYFAYQEGKKMIVEFEEAPSPSSPQDYEALAQYAVALERRIMARPQEWWFWPLLHHMWEDG